jgi:hypothetical protein
MTSYIVKEIYQESQNILNLQESREKKSICEYRVMGELLVVHSYLIYGLVVQHYFNSTFQRTNSRAVLLVDLVKLCVYAG